MIIVKMKGNYFTDFVCHGFFLEPDPRKKRGFTVLLFHLTVIFIPSDNHAAV